MVSCQWQLLATVCHKHTSVTDIHAYDMGRISSERTA